MLRSRLEDCGCRVKHVLSSRAGIEHLKIKNPNEYQLIITDITMETQLSGIFLVRRIRRMGFRGGLVIYSTGFNTAFMHLISRPFFRALGADGLISKNSLKNGSPVLKLLSGHPALETLKTALS